MTGEYIPPKTAGAGDPIGIVVLAAGSSSRLGEPKQLLPFEGETLLRRSVRRAIESGYKPVIVVLGSEQERFRQEAHYGEAQLVVNPEWTIGMGRSIAVGVEAALAAEPDLCGVIISLCDQPLITSDHFRALADTFHSTCCSVVATEYDGKQGVPALFGRSTFPELLALCGPTGASSIIGDRANEVSVVTFPGAETDVDIPEHYDRLLLNLHK